VFPDAQDSGLGQRLLAGFAAVALKTSDSSLGTDDRNDLVDAAFDQGEPQALI